jgi:hypothetical protein
MSYEMRIDAGVSGGPSIDAASASTTKLAAEVSGLNNQLYGSTAAQEKQTLTLIKLQTEQVKVAGYTVQYNIALLENARASTTAAAAQNELGAATQRTVGSTLAAGTAFRVLEGSMPIRAAATFLGNMQGIGAAMQLAFPLFGAIALVGVLDTIIGKVEKWANAHDPVIQAQTLSLSLLRQEGQEYDRLAKKAQDYNDKKFGDQFGKAALDRLQSSRYSRKSAQEDQDEINKLQNVQSVLSRLSKTSSLGGGNVTTIGQAPLTDADTKIAGTLRQILGDDPKYKDQLSGLEGLRGRQGGIIHTDEAAAAGELSVGIDQAIARSKMQQQSDRDDADAKKADAVKEDQTKAAEAARKQKESAARLAAIQAKSYDSQMTRLGFGPEYTALTKDAQATEKEVLEDPKNEAAIRRAHSITQAGIISEERRKATASAAEFQDLSSHPPEIRAGRDPNAAEENNGFMQDQMRAGGLFAGQLLTGYVSGTEQLRLARTGASRGLQLTQRAARDQDPSHAANNEYQARLAGINAVYSAEDRLAKTEQEHADAKATKEQSLFEAEMQREESLQAIIDKQKEAARSLAGGLFDAIHSHSTNQWTRAFGVGQEKALFENIASPLIGTASHLLGSAIPGQTDAQGNPTAIGNLLHGTILSSSNADPVKATALNTADTVKQLILMRGDMKNATTGNTGGADPNAVTQAVGINDLPISGAPGLGMLLGIGGGTSTSSAALSAVGQFAKALSGGPSAAFSALFQNTPPGTVGYGSDGTPHDQYGNPITQSGATIAGQAASIGAAFATGTIAAVSAFSKGGAGGALGGTSAILGMAAMVPSPASPFLAAGAAATGIAASLFSQGPAQRAQQFTNDIAKNQYLAPTALNVMQGMNGTYQSFDARGNIQTSTMRALPTVAEPYITTRELNGSQSWYDAPGNVTQPYQGGAKGTGANPVGNGPVSTGGSGTTVIINGGINAIDPSTFHELLQRPAYSMAVGESLATHLQGHEGRASNEIRYVAGA